MRDSFYQRSKLPSNPPGVADYLTKRLRAAFDDFLEGESDNTFAKATNDGWILSTDSAEILTADQKQQLERLIQWLGQHMRTIKLPDLLIEVDNDLRFTDAFMPPARQTRTVEDVCTILTTIMAYGCNIGPHTITQMIDGVRLSVYSTGRLPMRPNDER